MQQKMQLKIRIYVAIVTEVSPQIGASINIEQHVKPEKTLVQIPKMLKKHWTLKHRVKIQ